MSEDEFYLALGARIRAARKERGMDQETVAGKLGLTRASVINMEKGRQRPSIFQLLTIAKAFDKSHVMLLPCMEQPIEHYMQWASEHVHDYGNVSKEELSRIAGLIAVSQQHHENNLRP